MRPKNGTNMPSSPAFWSAMNPTRPPDSITRCTSVVAPHFTSTSRPRLCRMPSSQASMNGLSSGRASALMRKPSRLSDSPRNSQLPEWPVTKIAGRSFSSSSMVLPSEPNSTWRPQPCSFSSCGPATLSTRNSWNMCCTLASAMARTSASDLSGNAQRTCRSARRMRVGPMRANSVPMAAAVCRF